MHGFFLKTSHREAYLEAAFHSKSFQMTFKIGDKVSQLTEWAVNHRKQGNYLCWLTADNPLSLQLDRHENKKRFEQLKITVRSKPHLQINATDPKDFWPTERGFLILLGSPLEARNLAWKFQQKAILLFKIGRPVRMFYTLHHLGDPSILLNDFEVLIPEHGDNPRWTNDDPNHQKKYVYTSFYWSEPIAYLVKSKQALYINPSGSFPQNITNKKIQTLSDIKKCIQELKLNC
jgi:hypothetical protein